MLCHNMFREMPDSRAIDVASDLCQILSKPAACSEASYHAFPQLRRQHVPINCGTRVRPASRKVVEMKTLSLSQTIFPGRSPGALRRSLDADPPSVSVEGPRSRPSRSPLASQRLRSHRLGQQQRRVHSLRGWPQHRRTNSARIDIDQSGQLDPARHLIIGPDPRTPTSNGVDRFASIRRPVPRQRC